MQVLPIRTPLLKRGDDLAGILCAKIQLQPKDILVISSKAVATCEGAEIDLATLAASVEAIQWSKKCGKSPEFCEAVLSESERLGGRIVGSCQGAVLTLLRPAGMKTGSLLVPNAGLDQSNVQRGFAIGWPRDPVASARTIRTKLASYGVAVILSDSCCRPGRQGVAAFALCACGIDPIVSRVGTPDLFGTALKVTHEAVADQLATAANAVMGNAAESTPAAVIRGHTATQSDFCGWVSGIAPEEDLFRDILRIR